MVQRSWPAGSLWPFLCCLALISACLTFCPQLDEQLQSPGLAANPLNLRHSSSYACSPEPWQGSRSSPSSNSCL